MLKLLLQQNTYFITKNERACLINPRFVAKSRVLSLNLTLFVLKTKCMCCSHFFYLLIEAIVSIFYYVIKQASFPAKATLLMLSPLERASWLKSQSKGALVALKSFAGGLLFWSVLRPRLVFVNNFYFISFLIFLFICSDICSLNKDGQDTPLPNHQRGATR